MTSDEFSRPARLRRTLYEALARLVKERRVYIQFIEEDGSILTAEATGYEVGKMLTITSDRRELLRDK